MRKLRHKEIWGLTQGHKMKLEAEPQRIWPFLPHIAIVVCLCVLLPLA